MTLVKKVSKVDIFKGQYLLVGGLFKEDYPHLKLTRKIETGKAEDLKKVSIEPGHYYFYEIFMHMSISISSSG